jgi:hypothetical protein
MSVDGQVPEAGAPEIEITPAMNEAGAEILSFYEPENNRLSDTVIKIYRAMREEQLSRR